MLSAKQIIDTIRANPRIPAPSQTVCKVLSLTREADCELSKVAGLIGSDSGLTAQLLREANSALFAAAKSTSSTLQGCLRLGIKRIRAAVINQHVVSGLGKACPAGFDAKKHFQSALATSVAAHDLCLRVIKDKAEDAGTAGLLCDIGIGLIAYAIPADYKSVLTEWKQNRASELHKIEQRVLQVTHAEAGAAVLADWGLDPQILQAVRHHHCEPREAQQLELDPFVRIVAAAGTISRIALEGSDMELVANLFEQVEAFSNNADELVTTVLDVLVTHIQETASNLAIELGDTEGLETNLAELMASVAACENKPA